MTDNLYLSGNFGPIEEERTAHDLRVRGEIPEALNGRLLRIGPNPIAADPATYHWFLGNGMVHGVEIAGGRAVGYRNRFVRDDELVAAKGWPPVEGPARDMMAAGVANTNVIGHAGKTFAIVEGGNLPVELTRDLETVARSDFEGTLPGGFSAHPKRDPDTDELHTAVYSPTMNAIQYVVLGADGRVRKVVDVPVPGRPMVHDCSITKNYFVLLDLPVIVDEDAADGGLTLPYAWTPDYGARIGLLPREGDASDVTWHEVDPCFVFHPQNSYEDADGRVVLDVVRHPTQFNRTGEGDGPPSLDRWVIDPSGGPVKEERLDDHPQEFPRCDERLVGKPYRYGYGVEIGPGFRFEALLKHDVKSVRTAVHRGPESRLFMEPVFVPRHETAAEDEGWLLAYTYDTERDTSEVVILDAQHFEEEPVAVIDLPGRVPFGFHGNWVPNPA
ncbi:MAG: carotenoid oxygenase family protein [Myxococcota bacterium]